MHKYLNVGRLCKGGLISFSCGYFAAYYLGASRFLTFFALFFGLITFVAQALKRSRGKSSSFSSVKLLNLPSGPSMSLLFSLFFSLGLVLSQRLPLQQTSLGMPIERVKVFYGVVTRDARGDDLFRFTLRIFASSDGSALMTSAQGLVFVRAQRPNPMPALGQVVAVWAPLKSFAGSTYSRAAKSSIQIFSQTEQLKTKVLPASILSSKQAAYSMKTSPTPHAFWQKFWAERSKLRNRLFENLRQVFPRNGRNLFMALLFGSSEELPQEIKEQFRLAGCIHILALSGFHVGILATIVRLLLQPLFGLRRSLLISSIILTMYLWLVGPLPSLTRAVFMFLFLNFCRFFLWRANSLCILAISAIIQTLIFPEAPKSLSFQLSYSALLGLILFAERSSCLAGLLYTKLENFLRTRIQKPSEASLAKFLQIVLRGSVQKLLFQGLAVSLAVMLTTAPILIGNFARLHWIGLLASLIEAPIITLYMWSSLLLWPVLYLLNLMGLSTNILELAYQKLYQISLLPVESFSQVPPWLFQKASGAWLYSHLWAYFLLSIALLCALFRFELYRILPQAAQNFICGDAYSKPIAKNTCAPSQ